MADTSAAGAQPGPLPTSVQRPADAQHFAGGRGGQNIRFIVLHNTVGTDSLGWLTKDSPLIAPVSVHCLVAQVAPWTAYNLVAPLDTAWHVGTAIHPYTNENCLGLELESPNDPGLPMHLYPLPQLNTASWRIATWLYSFGLIWEGTVVRHGTIATPSGRRHDPWGLDTSPQGDLYLRTMAWLRFLRTVPQAELRHYIY